MLVQLPKKGGTNPEFEGTLQRREWKHSLGPHLFMSITLAGLPTDDGAALKRRTCATLHALPIPLILLLLPWVYDSETCACMQWIEDLPTSHCCPCLVLPKANSKCNCIRLGRKVASATNIHIPCFWWNNHPAASSGAI